MANANTNIIPIVKKTGNFTTKSEINARFDNFLANNGGAA